MSVDPTRLDSFIEILADESGTVALPAEIQILEEGSWKDTPNHPDFELTKTDLGEFADNFNKGVRKGVPIDIEHKNDPHFGTQAAGWIKEVYTKVADNGKMGLFGKPDWNNLGKELIGDKRYRFVSAEFNPSSLPYTDPEGKLGTLKNVLKAVTVTNHPLMKGLQPVTASDDKNISGLTSRLLGHIIYAEEGEKTVSKTLAEVLKLSKEELNDEYRKVLTDNADKLSEAELAKFEIAKPAEKKEEAAPEPTPALVAADDKTVSLKAGEVVVKASELAALEAGVKLGIKANEKLVRNEVKEIVSGHVKRGAIKADSADGWTEMIVKADEEGSKLLKKQLSELPANAMLAGERGTDEKGSIGSAADTLNQAADKIMADDKTVTPAEAAKRVLRENPELARQYNGETLVLAGKE